MDIFLIDTSVWIQYFRGKLSREDHAYIAELITADRAATTEVIVLEILRGAKGDKNFSQLKDELSALLRFEMDSKVWEQAYALGFHSQSKGYSIPTVDLIIAATAMTYDVLLLHKDKHFKQLSKLAKRLKEKEIK